MTERDPSTADPASTKTVLGEVDQAILDRWSKEMQNPQLARVLDEMAADICELVANSVTSNLHVFRPILGATVGTSEHAAIMALAVGWMLGFHSKEGQTQDEAFALTHQQTILAALSAGWSTNNTQRIVAKSRPN